MRHETLKIFARPKYTLKSCVSVDTLWPNLAAYSTLVSHPHRSHHHAFSRQAPIIPVSAAAAKTADLSTVNPSYISGNRSGSNTSINSVGSTTSSVSHFKSGYVQPSSSTYSTNTLGRMTKAIRNREEAIQNFSRLLLNRRYVPYLTSVG